MNPLRQVRTADIYRDEWDLTDWTKYADFKVLYQSGLREIDSFARELELDQMTVRRYIARQRVETERAVLNKPPRFEMG